MQELLAKIAGTAATSGETNLLSPNAIIKDTTEYGIQAIRKANPITRIIMATLLSAFATPDCTPVLDA